MALTNTTFIFLENLIVLLTNTTKYMRAQYDFLNLNFEAEFYELKFN